MALRRMSRCFRLSLRTTAGCGTISKPSNPLCAIPETSHRARRCAGSPGPGTGPCSASSFSLGSRSSFCAHTRRYAASPAPARAVCLRVPLLLVSPIEWPHYLIVLAPLFVVARRDHGGARCGAVDRAASVPRRVVDLVARGISSWSSRGLARRRAGEPPRRVPRRGHHRARSVPHHLRRGCCSRATGAATRGTLATRS